MDEVKAPSVLTLTVTKALKNAIYYGINKGMTHLPEFKEYAKLLESLEKNKLDVKLVSREY